jgi:hypothetical protein
MAEKNEPVVPEAKDGPVGEVAGGAVVKEAKVEPVVPEAKGDVVQIVTTAPGTLGPGGIVKVDTAAEISIEAFSAKWMKPANAASKKALIAAGKLKA